MPIIAPTIESPESMPKSPQHRPPANPGRRPLSTSSLCTMAFPGVLDGVQAIVGVWMASQHPQYVKHANAADRTLIRAIMAYLIWASRFLSAICRSRAQIRQVLNVFPGFLEFRQTNAVSAVNSWPRLQMSTDGEMKSVAPLGYHVLHVVCVATFQQVLPTNA